ncbi:MAG: glycosyltransferase family 39 protein [Candidatus Doudnabacteria bacterium]
MKKVNIGLVFILICALLLRIYNLTSISLWHDEAFSALLIRYPWHEMFYRIGLDVHPPAYYIALRLWSYLWGNSLASLRGFSVFFGVGTVYASYLFVKAAFKREELALAAALLVAINPFQIQYVTEARMYTFGTFVIMLSAYFLVKAFENESKKFWIAFAAATSLAMYTHYYLFFSVFAIGLFALYFAVRKYGSKTKEYRNFVGAYFLVFLSYIPWLKTFKFQFSQVQDNYWIPKIDRWSVLETNFRLLTGSGADPSKLRIDIILFFTAAFSLYLIYSIYKKNNEKAKYLILLAILVPFLGALALSLKQSIYLDRYFLFSALFYTIALTIFIFDVQNTKLRYVLLSIIILMSIFNWARFWTDLKVEDKPGMAQAAQYLNNNVGPNDHLDIASSFEYFNFKYYNHTGVTPLLYTPGIISINQLPHFSGTAILTNQDLIQDFNNGTKPGDTAWILWTNAFGGSKPNTPANWIQINEKGSQDVRPYPGTWIVVTEYMVR